MNTPQGSQDGYHEKQVQEREYLETEDPAQVQRQYEEEEYKRNFYMFGHSKVTLFIICNFTM